MGQVQQKTLQVVEEEIILLFHLSQLQNLKGKSLKEKGIYINNQVKPLEPAFKFI